MWVRVDSGITRHPKIYKLARLLSLKRAEAAGLVVGFLGYLAEYHHDGDFTGIDWDAAIEHAGTSATNPADVRAALLGAGWVDRFRDGAPVPESVPFEESEGVVLVWHDWDDWQGKLIDNREADAARKRSDRQARAALRDTRSARPGGRPADRPADVPGTTARRPAVRDETERDEGDPPPTPSAGAEGVNLPAKLPTGWSVAELKGNIETVVRGISDARLLDGRIRAAALFTFWYWAHVMQRREGDTLADPKRIGRIEARLREGADFRSRLNQVLFAIDGAKHDRNLMGQNEHNRKYDGVETILRDAAQVERLSALCPAYRAGKEHPLIRRAEARFQNGDGHE